jgi:DHA1 family multidrug resistance protein-like MFS transporter
MVEVVPDFAPKEMVGAYYGFNGYSMALGGSLGQIAGGWVYDISKQLAMPWLPWSICLLVGMLVVWQLYLMEQTGSRMNRGKISQKRTTP